MGKLDGKVAIVTGSGRGIGRAVALKLADEGAMLVVNDLDPEPAGEVVSAIEMAGGQAIACIGSVTVPDFPDRIVGTAIECFGGLDIIVNNAGYTRDGVIQKQDDAQFQEMLDVHLAAPFRILRAAADPIRAFRREEAEQGREVIRKVVNISSLAGTHGNAGQVNYASAKAGIVGLTKTLSKEWGRYKVCVNCVAFGFIETRLTKPNSDPESRIEIEGRSVQVGVPEQTSAAVSAMTPLGRPGTAEEAAGAVALMCLPESDYVSGQVLIASGGLVI
ncbi:3-oxoacyl-ACP reductase [Novosphingobium sp. PC22D]|uniref:SDR family NAD(P)-dependent oxidoreductase n=1 Tax=Novosphingobium sp. PC22D TaxID=1962403 RepID=UPI000BF17A6E|nr:SDR family NAD(P)-dependent oxidoreductase [Novosphingobium sp. PC22D]PEQ10602.1 3-oxoacyl-ACP reductase [Novosphingobium sp. PC22D]